MTEKSWADNTTVRATDITDAFEKQVIHTQTSDGSTYLGKHVYRSDLDLLKRYDGTSFRTYSRGQLGEAGSYGTGVGGFITSGSGEVTINLDIGGSSHATLDISDMIPGERYAMHASFRLWSSAANQVGTFKFYRDSTNVMTQADVPCPVASINQLVTLFCTFGATGSSHSMKWTVALGIGAGGLAITPGGDFSIVHLGG